MGLNTIVPDGISLVDYVWKTWSLKMVDKEKTVPKSERHIVAIGGGLTQDES